MVPSKSIAHYRVTSKLGEGGMGEVWRATDTKLGRDVAIKILPDAFAQDADRMARFKREAQVLASLNHPNIAAIYGVEERALVMELVEGPTLAERMAQGPIAMDEGMALAKQIADALEYAHEHGIIHRDLKPANIKVTAQGRIKILDFGLASVAQGSEAMPVDTSASPTLTLRATTAGVIMGTAAYMSPEQARGQAVDRRADVWAFGVVLYEMLTGRRLFSGSTVSDTLASVLKQEPDWQRVPFRVRRLLQACLAKDQQSRLRAVGDFELLVERTDHEVIRRAKGQPHWPWFAALFVVTIGGAGWWVSSRAGGTTSRPLLRFTDDIGVDAAPIGVALSPDGTRVAFVSSDHNSRGTASSARRLVLRTLANANPVALSGTEGAFDPVFSPDGNWIAFFADRKIKKIAVEGGAAITVCDVALGSLGLSWGEDGNLLFAPTNRSALFRVPDAGGNPEPVTHLDTKEGELTHRFPQVLPGAQAVLFTTGTPGNYEDGGIEVHVFKTGERKTIYRGGYHGLYMRPGYLLFVHEDTLFAAPMDLKKLALTGRPIPVVDDLRTRSSSGDAAFDVSQAGMMAYIPAGKKPPQALAWLDASGKLQRMSAPPKQYDPPFAFSRDGSRLALNIREESFGNIWVYDWAHDRLFPLTFGKGLLANPPAWSPDGNHLAFIWSGGTGGGPGIYWARADGSAVPKRLLDVPAGVGNLLALSPDGKQVVYFSMGSLWIVPLDTTDPEHPKAGEPKPFLTGPGAPNYPAFSPDGRWMSYGSEESGRSEVYVTSFPGRERKWLISTGGGAYSAWSRTKQELFYQTENGHMMQVSYRVDGGSFQADQPRAWSDYVLPRGDVFTLAPDGNRIVIPVPAAESGQKEGAHAVFLVNLADELKRRFSKP